MHFLPLSYSELHSTNFIFNLLLYYNMYNCSTENMYCQPKVGNGAVWMETENKSLIQMTKVLSN